MPYVGKMTNPDLITTSEAAQLLGCDVRTVHRMVQRGDLTPAQKFPGYKGAYLFDRAAVQARTTAAA